MTGSVQPEPPLPGWLAAELPYERRLIPAGADTVHCIDHRPANGSAPTVLLIHGNPLWCFGWRHVLRHLSDVRVVAPDLPGFGLSSKPRSPGEHSLQRHIDAVAAVVEALDLQDLVVCGHQWGGLVAAAIARRFSARVRGLVLVQSTGLLPAPGGTPSLLARLGNVRGLSELLFYGARFPVPVIRQVQGMKGGIGTTELRSYAYPFSAWRDRAGPLGVARLEPSDPKHPTWPVLKSIDRWLRAFEGPLTFIWGREDPIIGRAHERLAEVLPDAELVLTDAGHFVAEEAPEVIARAVRR